ncbi:MAG: DUF1232 domain-containing protein [Flavobacteriaceae bacterium]|nr:DUF1232 domain-containing protein [Flavobacteriaceae bacterium]
MSRLLLLNNIWRNKDRFTEFFTKENMDAFLRMIPLMIKGEYKAKQKRNIYIGLAAILYVISPIDLIPNFVFPVIGLMDDVMILAFGLKYINKEVQNFLLWEQKQKGIIFL